MKLVICLMAGFVLSLATLNGKYNHPTNKYSEAFQNRQH